MKYLAILRDSFREALDSTILYVLIGLSTLVILLVGTIGFKPLSAEQTMQQFFSDPRTGGPMIFVALNSHDPEKLNPENLNAALAQLTQFQLDHVELLSGEADSPRSDYVLTVTHRAWIAGPLEGTDGIRRIFKDAADLGLIRVGDIETLPGEKKEPTRYRVTLHGTADTIRIWAVEPSLFFGAARLERLKAPMGLAAFFLAKFVLAIGAWVAVLMSVVITAFFIPNMLRKGTIDMLLVKPTPRWTLLLCKYIGGLTFIFLNGSYAIGGIWLILGLRTGLWANNALLMIFTLTFFFAILYAIATLVGVVTRSTITTILLTFLSWFMLFLVNLCYALADKQVVEEKVLAEHNKPVPESSRWTGSLAVQSATAIHAILPRTGDLDYLNDLLVYSGFMTGNIMDIEKFDHGKHNWWLSFLVSIVWIGFYLTLACLWFSFKDY